MFIRLTDDVAVAGQLTPADMARAGREGFATVVNNRPDGEEPGQPRDADMRAAAMAAGLRYAAIPVGQAGMGQAEVAAMAAELGQGRCLAFCRSGTRSAHLWALAEASRGGDPDAIVAAAASGGYDVAMLLPALRGLAAR